MFYLVRYLYCGGTNITTTARFQIELDLYNSSIFRIRNITEPVLVGSGQDAMFECTFDANPIMYDGIKWLRHDGEAIETEGSRRFTIDWDDIGGSTVRSRLVVRNATVADAGKLFCAISNGYGKEARRETFLLVKRKYIYYIIQRETGILIQ